MQPDTSSIDPTLPAFLDLVATGTKHRTRYLPNTELSSLVTWGARYDTDTLSKASLWALKQGNKAAAIVILALLTTHENKNVYKGIFNLVIESLQDLVAFAEVMVSGLVGRRSLGTGPKRMIARWLLDQDVLDLFMTDRGSLAYILKLSHPRPNTPTQEAFFGWLLDRNYDLDALPEAIQGLIFFSEETEGLVPEVPGRYLETLELTEEQQLQVVARYDWIELVDRYEDLANKGKLEGIEIQEAVSEVLLRPPTQITPLLAWEVFKKTADHPIFSTAAALGLQATFNRLTTQIQQGVILIENTPSTHAAIPGQTLTYFEAALVVAYSLGLAHKEHDGVKIMFTGSSEQYNPREVPLQELLNNLSLDTTNATDSLVYCLENVDPQEAVYFFGRTNFSRLDLDWTSLATRIWNATPPLTTWCIADVRSKPTIDRNHTALSGLSEAIYQALAVTSETPDLVEAFANYELS